MAADPTLYITVDQFMATTEIQGYLDASNDIKAAIAAASRALDKVCNRRFWLDTDNTSVGCGDERAIALAENNGIDWTR